MYRVIASDTKMACLSVATARKCKDTDRSIERHGQVRQRSKLPSASGWQRQTRRGKITAASPAGRNDVAVTSRNTNATASTPSGVGLLRRGACASPFENLKIYYMRNRHIHIKNNVQWTVMSELRHLKCIKSWPRQLQHIWVNCGLLTSLPDQLDARPLLTVLYI